MSVIKLTQDNFQNEILNNQGLSIVDFYADWCGPCKMIAPIVEEIAKEHTELKVGKLNVDDNGGLAVNYKVMSIPTLIAFKDGKEHGRIIGYCSKQEILDMLK